MEIGWANFNGKILLVIKLEFLSIIGDASRAKIGEANMNFF